MMYRRRWHLTIGYALLPLLLVMAAQKPADNPRPTVGGPQAKVTNPHGPLAIPCENCHTYTSWAPIRSKPEFNHDQTGYPLHGMHQKVSCTQCHTSLFFKNTSTHCADCHADIHRRQFGANCESCHTVKGWNVTLDAIRNHQNRFPLIGAHALVECDQCHKGAGTGQFEGLSTACYSCHQQDFRTPVLNHVTAGFSTNCETCHTMDSWFGAKFDHLKYTGYALTGMHTTLACTACHINNVFQGTPATCYGCHSTDFLGTTNPPHAQLGLPQDCGTCHSTTNWLNATFDHTLYAHYPLTGMHATVACAQCHVNNNYTSTPTACYSCHQPDFTGTTNPNHVTAAFPTDCSLCHTTVGWTTSTFNHASVFPLTGAHATVPCVQCHTNNNYTTVPTDCFSCHKTDWNGTNAPPHAVVNFPTTCATCHSTTDWTGATFNHNTTSFPLTGAHISVACAQCHTNNNYTTLPTTCYGCHQADFTGTTNPPHVASNFPSDCTLCHNTASWTAATFNHNNTAFPLTGFHVTVPCAQCHVNNNYTTLPTDCYSCHTADWNSTNSPPHAASGFPTTCATCHNTTAWTTATFNHNNTAFPLTGAHTTVPCAQCHTNNNYTTLPTACYGCHQADFTGTNNPAHVAAGFPTDCTLCHTTSNWTTSTFNHASVFPLTGFHATMPCTQCHTNNNYTTLPTNCYGCHLVDWTGTNNPNHIAVAFPTTCDTCHTTTDWTSSITFNHTLYAGYALTGAHSTLSCVQCHANNNYVGTSTACYSCHQADFTGTTNPAHVAAGFPTDCSICHSTANWTSSTFNHSTTAFPLTGFHLTMPCVQCHTTSTSYNGSLPTACYGCHQADWNSTTDPNHASAGFPTTCDTCHTTTNWAGASFNHNNTPFPLTGAHTSVDCIKCHINNVFAGTPTVCYSCHAADFTGTTNPNHVTAGWPTTCTTCHTTTAWLPATLPASYHTFFPMTHGNANSVCATCHTNSSDYSVFQCTGCHGNNNAASFEHPNVNGYVYNSVNCYACHKNGSGG
jgi:hypothetical protein